MAEFVVFEQGVEAKGETIFSVIDAMKDYKDIAKELLRDNGILDIRINDWYPQQAWLNAFDCIAENFGNETLFNIGRAVSDNIELPSFINDINKGLALIDISYHMNHRINGNVMFNPYAGVMLEGIGHYIYTRTGNNEGKMVGHTPYPCEFDRGIIYSMARRFKSFANVTLDTSVKNKKDGATTSSYIITW